MPATVLRVAEMPAADRSRAIHDAADALSRGAPIIVPTETVYSLAVRTSNPDARALIQRVRAPRTPVTPEVWNAAFHSQLEDAVPLTAWAHNRLIRRLSPGPAIFVLPLEADALRRAADRLGIPTASGLAVRISAHPVCHMLAEAAAGPIFVEEVHGADGWASTAGSAAAGAESAGLRDPLILDDGRATLAKPATIIQLEPPPPPVFANPKSPDSQAAIPHQPYRIIRPGAYEDRFIRKQLDRLVLFVCTGNTCRSPMAEAIAADLLRTDPALAPLAAGLRIGSAGTTAHRGEPTTAEAVEALKEVGIRPAPHTSRPLTRHLIDEADLVFAMTRSHLRAILAMDPAASDKAALLDPSGEDIPDPIGFQQQVYTETARRMRDLISRRLKEMDR